MREAPLHHPPYIRPHQSSSRLTGTYPHSLRTPQRDRNAIVKAFTSGSAKDGLVRAALSAALLAIGKGDLLDETTDPYEVTKQSY